MKIDTRFPAQPKDCQIPLYPKPNLQQIPFPPLNELIGEHYCVKPEQVFLMRKASVALALFLKWRYHPSKSVCLPAFCCPEVLQAIHFSGINVVFCDLNPDLTPVIDKEFLKKHKTEFILWPSFFGSRKRKDFEDKIIHDDAQSFPESNKIEEKRLVSLFSFGRSKKISCSFGGGLCIHDPHLAREFNQFINHFEKFNLNFVGSLKRESHLDVLLNKRMEEQPILQISTTDLHLSAQEQDIISRAIVNYRANHQKYLETFRKFTERFEAHELKLLNGIDGLPSVLALWVENRYLYSEQLAKEGIQTTWYYYPLNLLNCSQKYPCMPINFTYTLSNSILILPKFWFLS